MFKQYIRAGDQSQPEANRGVIGIDLMTLVAYVRVPLSGYVTLYVPGSSGYNVFMTPAEFDEFQTNVKTANRLKRAYE